MPKSWSLLVKEVVRSYVNLNIVELVAEYEGPIHLVRRTEDEIISLRSVTIRIFISWLLSRLGDTYTLFLKVCSLKSSSRFLDNTLLHYLYMNVFTTYFFPWGRQRQNATCYEPYILFLVCPHSYIWSETQPPYEFHTTDLFAILEYEQ